MMLPLLVAAVSALEELLPVPVKVEARMGFADEAALLLAREESEERLCEAMVTKLRVYRTAIERVLVAPFGSIELCDAKELQLLAQDVLRRRLRQRADALLGG